LNQETNGTDAYNVVNTGDIEEEGARKQKRSPARFAVVPYRVSAILAHLLAFARSTPKIREYLGLAEEFEVAVIGGNYPAPGSLPGTDGRSGKLSAHKLERQGYAFFCEAEVTHTRLFEMLEEANTLRQRDRKNRYHSLLDFVTKESGAMTDEPYLNALVEPLSMNSERLEGLMDEDDYLELRSSNAELHKGFNEVANSTPNTVRDASNFYRALNLAFEGNPTEAWEVAIWEAELRINVLRELPPSLRPTSIKGDELWVPELNEKAPKELHEIYERTFKAREIEWQKLMKRLAEQAEIEDPAARKWSYQRSTTPVELKLVNGNAYRGHIVVTVIEDPSPMATSAARFHVRKTIEQEAETNDDFKNHLQVPILVFQIVDRARGYYFLQTSAGWADKMIDVSFAGVAWRSSEIMFHEEYQLSARQELVANEEYLARTGVVPLMNEDRSVILIAGNRTFVSSSIHPMGPGLKLDPETAIRMLWTAMPEAK